ncbi:clusterin-associated protein 1-like [Homarus americanus]|uniref:clusterin-associated protein 1-like n=1 Tax=Homarus americanus TaxID=6706 RepID=UPI001C4442B4|nr:clusterin-associated protein 1-like [Homarus americanus]
MLRALGFRRLISLENFRRPNFPLVAEILGWLVHRFEPNADLPTHTDTEQDRVIFIRSVAQFMAAKANVRLNTKRLYQADGYAVQEILKGLSLLYSAMPNNKDDSGFDDDSETTLNFDVSNKISELKHIRSLASEISSRGATLYDLLRREVDLREIRTNIINRQLELTEVEEGMQSAISACEREGKPNQTAIENVGSDQSNLEAKIDKKKTGLERGQKRLLTLKKVRPAFMDEYEKLEQDLKRQYESFVQKFISLSYLENLLDDYDRIEQEKMAERESATRKMLEKLRTEESHLGSGGEDDSDDTDDDDDDDDDEDELLKDKVKDTIMDKGGKDGVGKGRAQRPPEDVPMDLTTSSRRQLVLHTPLLVTSQEDSKPGWAVHITKLPADAMMVRSSQTSASRCRPPSTEDKNTTTTTVITSEATSSKDWGQDDPGTNGDVVEAGEGLQTSTAAQGLLPLKDTEARSPKCSTTRTALQLIQNLRAQAAGQQQRSVSTTIPDWITRPRWRKTSTSRTTSPTVQGTLRTTRRGR